MEEAVAAVTSGLPVPSKYIKMHPGFIGLDPFFRHRKVWKLQPAQEGVLILHWSTDQLFSWRVIYADYTTKNKNGIWKWTPGKGHSFWKSPFLRPTLVFQAALHNTPHIASHIASSPATPPNYSHQRCLPRKEPSMVQVVPSGRIPGPIVETLLPYHWRSAPWASPILRASDTKHRSALIWSIGTSQTKLRLGVTPRRDVFCSRAQPVTIFGNIYPQLLSKDPGNCIVDPKTLV